MATLIPDPPLDFHGSPGEQAVYEALRLLPDGVIVLHSLRWIRSGHGQGEGDFIVFDPARGVLVIEVKSGGIRFENGVWWQTNQGTGIEKQMKDPEAQASRTRFDIIESLNSILPSDATCPVYHAVWFPSVRFPRSALPPQLKPEMILDVDDLRDPRRGIDAAFAFGSGLAREAKLSKAATRRVLEALAPTIHAVPSMRQSVESRDKTFVRLTMEQARVLDYLDEQNRAVVAGAAGTGKTMVALALARRLADRGQEVLLLCYNAPLRQYLETHHHSPRITFHTFDSLAATLSPEDAGDFDRAKQNAVDLLASPNAPSFEHVLIDEGQDFEPEWIDALEANTTGVFYAFFDRNQLIQRERIPAWIERADCRLVLRRNCRTTTQVARLAYQCALTPIPPCPDTVDGPKPRLYRCSSRDAAALMTARILQALLTTRDYKPDEIALLTFETPSSSLLGQIARVGTAPVHDAPRRGHITFSSIRRFKGLEAKAIVLLDLQPSQLADPSVRSLLYVGASRAMHELHVVFDHCDRDGINVAARSLLRDGRKPNAVALGNALGANWVEESDDV